jgi:branched-chain amino acid aminotransferase
LLRLAPDLGFPVREARLDIDEILAEVRSGRISEAFCMGTAAVLVPIGRIGLDGADVVVNDGTPGPVASELYRALTSIQYGEAPDPYGWTSVIDEHAVLERCQG